MIHSFDWLTFRGISLLLLFLLWWLWLLLLWWLLSLLLQGIDDLCLKYFVEAGAIAIRRVKLEDMKRIAKATGGQIVVTMADMEGDEAFDEKTLGECAEVSEERVGDGELMYFRGCKNGRACTVVLRGANEFMLDEMDRSLHDALCVIKRMCVASLAYSHYPHCPSHHLLTTHPFTTHPNRHPFLSTHPLSTS